MTPVAKDRRAVRAAFVLAWLVALPALPALAEEPAAAVGSVDIEEFDVGTSGRSTLGMGTLDFHGKQRRFQIAGLGAGVVGVSTVSARGEVFQLEKVDQFAGTYTPGRIGSDIAKGSGLWLKNEHGVVLRLTPKAEGIELVAGVEGVVIHFE